MNRMANADSGVPIASATLSFTFNQRISTDKLFLSAITTNEPMTLRSFGSDIFDHLQHAEFAAGNIDESFAMLDPYRMRGNFF